MLRTDKDTHDKNSSAPLLLKLSVILNYFTMIKPNKHSHPASNILILNALRIYKMNDHFNDSVALFTACIWVIEQCLLPLCSRISSACYKRMLWDSDQNPITSKKSRTMFVGKGHWSRQYKLKRCSKNNVVNNVDMSSLRASWQNGAYKITHNYIHRTAHKHAEHQDATDIQKQLFCVFRIFLFLFFLFMIS